MTSKTFVEKSLHQSESEGSVGHGAMTASHTDYYEYPDGRMNTQSASAYLGLSVATLAIMRSKGRGPTYVKMGRIFYYREDLDEWMRSKRVDPRGGQGWQQ